MEDDNLAIIISASIGIVLIIFTIIALVIITLMIYKYKAGKSD